MTEVAILPQRRPSGGTEYRAVAGDRQAVADTAGKALDALTAILAEDEPGTMVVLPSFRPDSFFTAEQQDRLRELMGRWRAARDAGRSLPAEEQSELETLVDAELRASGDRAAAIADRIGL